MGLEPTTAAMARRYSSQLSYARERRYIIDILEKARKKSQLWDLRKDFYLWSIANTFHVCITCKKWIVSWPLLSRSDFAIFLKRSPHCGDEDIEYTSFMVCVCFSIKSQPISATI